MLLQLQDVAILGPERLLVDGVHVEVYAGAVTALLCGQAYQQSARIAAELGAYEGYEKNRDPMLGVIEKHRNQAMKLSPTLVPLDLLHAARSSWDQALSLGREVGFRSLY